MTHTVNYEAFPASLKIVLVFDTKDSKTLPWPMARRTMVELTDKALADADVRVRNAATHVYYDSEEECQRACGGNWLKRLSNKG